MVPLQGLLRGGGGAGGSGRSGGSGGLSAKFMEEKDRVRQNRRTTSEQQVAHLHKDVPGCTNKLHGKPTSFIMAHGHDTPDSIANGLGAADFLKAVWNSSRSRHASAFLRRKCAV